MFLSVLIFLIVGAVFIFLIRIPTPKQKARQEQARQRQDERPGNNRPRR